VTEALSGLGDFQNRRLWALLFFTRRLLERLLPVLRGQSGAHQHGWLAAGAFGEYRRRVGWGGGRVPASRRDTNHLFTARLRAAPPGELPIDRSVDPP
jgi:hypothetical protein